MVQLRQSDGESVSRAWTAPGTQWPMMGPINLSVPLLPLPQELPAYLVYFFLKMRCPGVLSPWAKLLDSTVGLPSLWELESSS